MPGDHLTDSADLALREALGVLLGRGFPAASLWEFVIKQLRWLSGMERLSLEL